MFSEWWEIEYGEEAIPSKFKYMGSTYVSLLNVYKNRIERLHCTRKEIQSVGMDGDPYRGIDYTLWDGKKSGLIPVGWKYEDDRSVVIFKFSDESLIRF